MQRLDVPIFFVVIFVVGAILITLEDLSKEQTKRFEACLKETKDAKVCQLVMRY